MQKRVTRAAFAMFVILASGLCFAGDERPSEKSQPRQTPHQLTPVPGPQVTMEDAFWSPRFDQWRQTTIPDVLDKFERDGAVANYEHVRDGHDAETHRGPSFSDGLLCEVLRGCSDFLATRRDAALEARIDGIVDRIAAAQAKDPSGYVNTYTMLKEPTHRWGTNGGNDVIQHDIYNAGCLVEAAIHYYRATGKTKFLEVAVRLANCMSELMGKPPKGNFIPGHSISEEALVKLAVLFQEQPELKKKMPVNVDETAYVKLAESWIENRGNHVGRKPFEQFDPGYIQDQMAIFDQATIEGHAVRATLMCTGIAALAPVNGRGEYYATAERLWENMVGRRMYISGGVGAIYGIEAFGRDYELPNAGYLETCAAVAAGFFDRNMNLAFGDARYADELERELYNGALCGISLAGNCYSYINPLEFEIGHSRWDWHGCPCCPPMFLKIMGALPGYIYATDANSLYVNLFVGSRAETLVHGGKVVVRQTTQYPWEGAVQLAVEPAAPTKFDLCVRIPEWCRDAASFGGLYRGASQPDAKAFQIKVNGEPVEVAADRGYARLSREWRPGDRVEVAMAMPIQRVKALPAVTACEGRVALMRGPVVYAVETVRGTPAARSIFLPPDAPLTAVYRKDLMGGMTVLEGTFQCRMENASNPTPVKLEAIPYFAYGNRGPAALRIWIPETAERTVADSLAARATPSASFFCPTDSLWAMNDAAKPVNSDDSKQARFSWWDHKGTQEWVQYDFAGPTQVSAIEVYWWADAPRGKRGCDVPKSWQLLYREGNEWKPVADASPYGVQMDQFNRVTFKPVTTTALRIEAQLKPDVSGGILEWKVE